MTPAISSSTVHEQDRIVALRQYIDRRMASLRNERLSWWTHWQDLSNYIMPRRGRFLLSPNQSNLGDMRNQKIIDNTGTLAARTLASGLMAGLTSPDHAISSITCLICYGFITGECLLNSGPNPICGSHRGTDRF